MRTHVRSARKQSGYIIRVYIKRAALLPIPAAGPGAPASLRAWALSAGRVDLRLLGGEPPLLSFTHRE